MYEEGEGLWKDSKGYYKQDPEQLSFSQNSFFKKFTVKASKDYHTPSYYSSKYAYMMDNFGDIYAPLFTLFEEVIHHKQKKKSLSLSAFCVQFFSKNVVRKFLKTMNLEMMKQQIFGNQESKENDMLIRRLQKPAKLEDEEKFEKQIRNYRNETIQTYLQNMLTNYSSQKVQEYIDFLNRNLSYLVIDTKTQKKERLEKYINILKPMFNFTLMEKKPQGDEKKNILLSNRFDKIHHFLFQEKEEKIFQNFSDSPILSLEDMILSFQTVQKTSQFNMKKEKLLSKLFCHLLWELQYLEKCSKDNGQHLYYELIPSNIYFNFKKQFFFLNPEPLIYKYLLGYKNLPTTKKDFQSIEKVKKEEHLFKAPEELTAFYGEKIKNTVVYRLMRIISCLEKLNISQIHCHNSYDQFFNRKLDTSKECKKLFGNFVHNILCKTYQKYPKNDQYGPSLAEIADTFNEKFQFDQAIEVHCHKYWLKGGIILLIMNQIRGQEIKKEEKEKKRLKLLFYFCLWVINKKKQLEYCPIKSEKWKIFQEYVKYIEILNITKESKFEFQKKAQIKDEKLKQQFRDLSFQVQKFIKEIIFLTQNQKLRQKFEFVKEQKNKGNLSLQIHIENPQQKFLQIYTKGKVFLHDSIDSSSPRNQIKYELVGKISHENIQWITFQVFENIKNQKFVDENWFAEQLKKLNKYSQISL